MAQSSGGVTALSGVTALGGVTALRGTLVNCLDDPFLTDADKAFTVERDGVVVCRDGKIEAVGPASDLLAGVPLDALSDYSGCLIAPGFIDTHVHYVQTGMVASYGTQLLDWLDRYAFPAELEFADAAHAAAMAKVFCEELLRNGTTTALVFCAVYPQSVDALFAEAERHGMRIIAGKVLMDRNAPQKLRDTAQRGYDESKALIARWHGRGRSLYAITPRFAGSSTPAQLDAAGTLWREHPDVLVQTHIAENRREVEWTAELFPQAKNYLDIYDQHGLIGRRAVLAHGTETWAYAWPGRTIWFRPGAPSRESGEVRGGELPRLDQHHPVAGVVAGDGLHAVRALLRRLDELHALGPQVVVGLPAVVHVQAEAGHAALVERAIHRGHHLGRVRRARDGQVDL